MNTNHDEDREPFGSKHFRQFDPQSRIEEFQKRIDQLKSNFPSATRHRQMFEPGNFGPTGGMHPAWSQRNFSPNENVSNGHVPMEKTIPIHVQHERTPSREENQRQQSTSPNNNMNEPPPPPGARFASFHDPSFFHQKFHDAFNHPGAESSESSEPPRVHHIPIHLESRPGAPVTPSATNSASPQPAQCGASQPPPKPSQPHPPHPPASHAQRANVIEVPIQICKSSSTPETNRATTNTATNAACDKSTVTSNETHQTNQVNESASDPNIANPKIVYAMGYEPLNKSDEANNAANQTEGAKQETPFDYVREVLDDLKNYESQVNEFNGSTSDDKGYRFLDEMLTLCVLRLDCINIDGNDELRKYRKSAINEVNRVIGMLEAKVSRHQPDQPMETDTPKKEVPLAASEVQSSEEANQQTSSGLPIPLPMSPQPSDTDATGKDDGKKKKKGKDKSPKEKKEGKRIIFFRKKSANKDLDTNNNDLKQDEGSSVAGSSSDQASETASNCSDSTVTLKGHETEV